MKLPNGEQAVIDPRKLFGYSLDPEHDEGQHKAHLFESLLGVNRANAQLLLEAVEQAAVSGDALLGKLDQYGQRYAVDLPFTGPNGTATIRTAWIIRNGEEFPRLVTCFIL
ncbi:MAG TPA: hypothetical protein PKC18_12255 [Lacipirellulaceae bacterium]|nr:hypothetical protein [Lacipirellulaceae bacterium]HMP08397.1 hypothetical protein [Lacipirellulaceae bacterium]